MTLLQIYHWICQWKNCENQLTFGRLWARVSVLFSRLPVYLAHSSIIVHTGKPKTSSQKFLKRWEKNFYHRLGVALLSRSGHAADSCKFSPTKLPIHTTGRHRSRQFRCVGGVNWAIKQQDPNADYSRVAVIAQWSQNSASAQGSVHTHNRCSGDVRTVFTGSQRG